VAEGRGRILVGTTGLIGRLGNGEGDNVVRVLTEPSLSEKEAEALRFLDGRDGWECEGVVGFGLGLRFGLALRFGDGDGLSVCLSGEARNFPLAL